ncbi:lytic transglycosylase domain-containing protein [Vibrio brasiliensis]|uniref:lytic transglycosylase domain-containing protein n=1 Tax=Vibrio brasiliensis TaxID=170652 RepID=UPI001EFD0290|nr:lytic transglycosylase domain-containing protein [Vibrio brasiliensis]MCG9647976.1 lytic transglycosylase domain-containing protein [Vibrio brasiliensis]
MLTTVHLSRFASAFCFEEAAAHYNISPKLLRAIAQVESSFNFRAYNENKNESGEITSRDYGLMQIYSSWFSRLLNSMSMNPMFMNHVLMWSLGAWILASNFAGHSYNWNSVGAYNAGFAKRAENARKIYIKKVQAVYFSPNFQ